MTYNNNILKVLNGYTNLTEDEKREFVRELNTYIESDAYQKRNIKTLLETRQNLGPTSNDHCTCCGRG